jgi:hypothetical protein
MHTQDEILFDILRVLNVLLPPYKGILYTSPDAEALYYTERVFGNFGMLETAFNFIELVPKSIHQGNYSDLESYVKNKSHNGNVYFANIGGTLLAMLSPDGSNVYRNKEAIKQYTGSDKRLLEQRYDYIVDCFNKALTDKHAQLNEASLASIVRAAIQTVNRNHELVKKDKIFKDDMLFKRIDFFMGTKEELKLYIKSNHTRIVDRIILFVNVDKKVVNLVVAPSNEDLLKQVENLSTIHTLTFDSTAASIETTDSIVKYFLIIKSREVYGGVTGASDKAIAYMENYVKFTTNLFGKLGGTVFDDLNIKYKELIRVGRVNAERIKTELLKIANIALEQAGGMYNNFNKEMSDSFSIDLDERTEERVSEKNNNLANNFLNEIVAEKSNKLPFNVLYGGDVKYDTDISLSDVGMTENNSIVSDKRRKNIFKKN